jgi:hypothetical protein
MLNAEKIKILLLGEWVSVCVSECEGRRK